MNAVTIISPKACLEHDTGPGHPESIARLACINRHLAETGLLSDVTLHEAPPVHRDALMRAHTASHVDSVERAVQLGLSGLDADTTLSARSWDAALFSAGAAVEGVQCLQNESAKRVFCAVRPPGHHAEEDRAMGFCLFNNAAIAALTALERGFAERVLIVDWDVHHGNGTQAIFEQSNQVFFYSIHQYPFYPGTGGEEERGAGAGEGFTLNRPLSSGAGDDIYRAQIERDLEAILKTFHPDLIIISAGFDAHHNDPLGGMRVSTHGFARMTRFVSDVADSVCGGKVLSLLEGGYDLSALSECAAAHLAALVE